MKRYKAYFSLWNLLSGTQPEIVKLQGIIKVFTTFIAGSTWYMTNPTNALFVGIGGFVLDLILGCIYLEEIV